MTTRGRQAWRDALRDRTFVLELVVTFVVVIITIGAFSHFLRTYVEVRPGAVFRDPLLARFDPIDLSIPSFVLIYGALLLAVGFLLQEPRRLVLFAQAYVLLLAFRTATLYLVPLEAPPNIIPLVDPAVGMTTRGQTLTKDLFFSGHTATMFLLALSARPRWLRVLFYVSTAFVGAGVLLQHVHYSIDVAVAPFVAFAAWWIVTRLHGLNGTQ